MTAVLFVCLGNICRSPMAEGVFRHLVDNAGLKDQITIDSAGNGSWHQGNQPDPRAIAVMRKYGIDITRQRSRPVVAQDFRRFDLILAMDHTNIENLNHDFPDQGDAEVALFIDKTLGKDQEVPDPYYGGDEGFDRVYDMILEASQALLAKLK